MVAFHYLPPTDSKIINALARSGPAAVGFFFLLSGFVLAHRHPACQNLGAFWRARLIRIYPMYLLAFAMFLPFAIWKYHQSLKSCVLFGVLNIFMMQAWTPFSQSWNGPSWSLSVEAFLYFIFPFLVTKIGKSRSRLIWGFFALVPAAATALLFNGLISEDFWRSWIGNNPLFWVPIFCFGIALGLWRRALPNSEIPMDVPLALALLCLVASAVLWPPNLIEFYINGGVVLLLAAVVVLSTCRTAFCSYLIGNKVMDALGKASYITYIIQTPVWHTWHAAENHFRQRALSDERSGPMEFALFVAFLLCVSVLLDQLVDKPVRKRLSLRFARSSPR